MRRLLALFTFWATFLYTLLQVEEKKRKTKKKGFSLGSFVTPLQCVSLYVTSPVWLCIAAHFLHFFPWDGRRGLIVHPRAYVCTHLHARSKTHGAPRWAQASAPDLLHWTLACSPPSPRHHVAPNFLPSALRHRNVIIGKTASAWLTLKAGIWIWKLRCHGSYEWASELGNRSKNRGGETKNANFEVRVGRSDT